MIKPETLSTDILVIGAGPVGMAFAQAMREGPWRVLLLDHHAPNAWQDDPRALALAHGSRQMLEQLGAWQADAATPIRDIHVSQRAGFGRTLLHADDYQIPALGYVMRYRDLAAALQASLSDFSQDCLSACRIESLETTADYVKLTVRVNEQSQTIKARLVVHAEGAPLNDLGVKTSDYRQHAVIAEVRPAAEHQNRAWERFTPQGPLALLPLGTNYSVVFTQPASDVARILSLSDDAFLATLQESFGQRVQLLATSPRRSFPLFLRVRSKITQLRQVWVGNSAQTLHPVSGQGFNLGLRDAWVLAESLLNRAQESGFFPSLDPANPATLARYASARQADRRASEFLTDGLVRLFSNDQPALKTLRGLGLLALDLCPPLRHLFARQMIWGARK